MEKFVFTGSAYVYISDFVKDFSYSPKNPKVYDSERFTNLMLESLDNKDYYESGYFFSDEAETTNVNDFVMYDCLPKLPIWDKINEQLHKMTYQEKYEAHELNYQQDYVVESFQNYIVKEACPFDTIKEHIDEVTVVFSERENAFLPVAKTDYNLQQIWDSYILTDEFKKLTEEAKKELDAYLERTKEDKEKEEERDDR